ncbi:MAG: hypothetical protein KGJ62_08510 [Armatimonadetes bacterium]|nr:hypothetical protein [Armatimonadota bacterium]MDE2205066.1 hypothetical protein [Armatimonadota bacterium]
MRWPIGIALTAAGVAAVYREGARFNPTASPPVGPAGERSIELDNVDFACTVGGAALWRIHADRITMRAVAGAIGAMQEAHCAGLRGSVYQSRGTGAPELTPSDAAMPHQSPDADFTAASGDWDVGGSTPLPASLAFLFNERWQLQLDGGVKLSLRNGHRLAAARMVIYELLNRATQHVERRVVCSSGAKVSVGKATMTAGGVVYDPHDRSVEADGGVGVTIQQAHLSASRAFWLTASQTLRCPEQSTGVVRGIRFQWTGLVVSMAKSDAIYRATAFRALVPVAAALIALQHSAAGQTPLRVAPVTPPKATRNLDISVSGGGTYDSHTREGTATGLIALDGKTRFTADSATWSDATHIMKADGHLTMDDAAHHVTANLATVHYASPRHALLTGDVVMVVKPAETPDAAPAAGGRPSSGAERIHSARAHGFTVTCDQADYFYGKVKHGTFAGSLKFHQLYTDDAGKTVERWGTANRADYDDKSQTLTLYPPVHFWSNRGEDITTQQKLTIHTEPGHEKIIIPGAFHMLLPSGDADGTGTSAPPLPPAKSLPVHGSPVGSPAAPPKPSH